MITEKQKATGIIVSGISLGIDSDESEACDRAAEELKRAGISPARLRFEIYRRSVDARKKKQIKIVYAVAAYFDAPFFALLPKSGKYQFSYMYENDIEINKGSEKTTLSPLVVGMGPAGLFAALVLAENGYSPIIIDRGDDIKNRCESYERFVKLGILDTESNIQFGAGGAGTFSDGKLLTRINDAKINYVLRRFCDFGAPNNILCDAKPHIGTDLLREVVDNMLCYISSLGGKVFYRTRLDDIQEISDGNIRALTSKGEFECSALILATGHSARDTYKMLIERGYMLTAKPFSVGVRIEHLREDIDRALYGDMAGHPKLGKGEYHLSDTGRGRGVYTFCMCPGGEVVAGASEEGGVVVNGMSHHARDGRNSNSAVAVTVFPSDHDSTPMGAIEFVRNIEKRAFAEGGGDYTAPVMTVGDFISGSRNSLSSKILPTYREGKVRAGDFSNIFPDFVTEELRFGLESFGKKLSTFGDMEGVLTAAETRTSAPVRIQRDEEFRAVFHDRVYPCGEGAGYAGGITSSAIDGIKAALKVIERFAPCEKN